MRPSALSLIIPAIAVLSGSCVKNSDPEKPNVIFILADDLGFGDLACYDNPYIETPVIDKLASQGIRLTNCYAGSAICAPSRAATLTGRYNHRTGAIDVSSNRGIDRINLSEKTMGDYFRNAGYVTGLIGKWHCGIYNDEYLPFNRGFDFFYGFPNGVQDYYNWNLMRNGIYEKHDGRYLTDVINREAISFIEKNKNRPFFLFMAHHAPHSPLLAPDSLIQKYKSKNDGTYSDDVARIYAMIEAMDTGLGWVIDKLEEVNLTRKTIIVLTSDNGAWIMGSYDRFKAGLSGCKSNVLEEGIKVPGIVVWPGKIKAGITIDTPLSGIDWLPTLFSLTGGKAPENAKPFDGENLMPVFLQEKIVTPTERILYFQLNRYTSVQHSDATIKWGKWKLYWPGVPETMKKDNNRDNPSVVKGTTEKHWEMPIDYELNGYEYIVTLPPKLFNLEEDPYEKKDLSASYPDIVDSLSILYDRWFGSVHADWKVSFNEIIEHDKAYWKDRTIPDARILFKNFWFWNRVKADSLTADPLEVFRGYWDYSWK